MNKNLKKLIAAAISITSAISVTTGVSVSADWTNTTSSTGSSGTNISYTGEAITPDIVLYDDDIQLVKGTDYDLAYENNINVGTATIIVTFKGNYTGERRINFNIIAKALGQDDVVISPIENQIFTGEPITPKPTVTFGDKTLVEGADYDLEYENNTDAGTAVVNVIFKGNYSGSASASFVIECLCFAIRSGNLPKLPSSWLRCIQSMYGEKFAFDEKICYNVHNKETLRG